jgi:serine/threonine-protein kinase RsbW
MCAASPLPQMAAVALCAATFPASMTEVRTGLALLLASPALCGLGPDDRGTAELLLAEALNNVVEHAYARWSGEIEVRLGRGSGHVDVCIIDQGLPMPDVTPPAGHLPTIGAPEDLPEGGFGWFLIRSLAEDLSYRRIANRNELSFRIPLDNWES